MNSLAIFIIILVIVAITCVILYFTFKNAYNPILHAGVLDAYKQYTVTSDVLTTTKNEFTFSFWFYLEDWTYKYNENKHILVWDTDKLIVSLNKKQNYMKIQCKDVHGKMHECRIVDLKLQKWNHIAINLWFNGMDIFMDGKFKKTCNVGNLPDYTNSNSITLFDNYGYDGYLSNLLFYTNAIKIDDIMTLYNGGYNYYSLANRLTNFFGQSAEVTSN